MLLANFLFRADALARMHLFSEKLFVCTPTTHGAKMPEPAACALHWHLDWSERLSHSTYHCRLGVPVMYTVKHKAKEL